MNRKPLFVSAALAFAVFSLTAFDNYNQAIQAGRTATQAKKFDEAAKAYEEAGKLAKTAWQEYQVIFSWAEALRSKKSWAEAEKKMSEILANDKMNPVQKASAQLYLGHYKNWQGKKDDALAEYGKVIAMGTKSSPELEAYNASGNLLNSMKKYPEARASTSGEQSTARKASLRKSHCTAMSKSAHATAMPEALAKISAASLMFPFPNACAVRPPVPTLRNPKFQYSRSKSMVPMAMPPIMVATDATDEASRCPATAISTIPTSGTVTLASMLGTARFNMFLFTPIICTSFLPQAFPNTRNNVHNLQSLPLQQPSRRSPAHGCAYTE